MKNQHLETALCDLIEAIKGINLGSVTATVIDGAAKELICNWNSHLSDGENDNDWIDVNDELNNWEACKRDNGQYFLCKPHSCEICGCAGGH